MKKRDFPSLCSWIAVICGICLMVFGVYRGEMTTVFQKAVNICLECIGIG